MFASYRTRVQVSFVGIALTAVAVSGLHQSWGAKRALEQQALESLTASCNAKHREVERYFADARVHLLALAQDPVTLAAFDAFRGGWAQLPAVPDRQGQLHALFLSGSEYPPGRRDLLDRPEGTTAYGAAHQAYHPVLRRFQRAFGFYDLFFVDSEGDRVLYTVVKEPDLGADLQASAARGEGLSRACRRALSAAPGEVVIEDYAAYTASANAQAAFLATPLWRDGARVGVFAAQVSTDDVALMLAGDDDRFSLMSGEGRPRGGAGFEPGVEVLEVRQPLQIPGVDWTLVGARATAQVFAPVFALRRWLVGWALIAGCVFLAVGWVLGRSVTAPVLALSERVARLGAGDFSVRMPESAADELGLLARAFNQMASDLTRTTVSRDRLDEAHRALRQLTQRLMSSQEEERARVARELHDDVTQRLASAAIELGRLRTQSASDGLRALQVSLAQLSEDVHGLSRRLHPALLSELGFRAAVEAEARASFERGGPPVQLQLEAEPTMLRPEGQLALFRIVQEALRNAGRHAHADEIRVSLTFTPGRVRLTVQDDGRGFDALAPGWKRGLGLDSMDERAKLLGGTFQLQSKAGVGTRIDVEVPT